MRNGDTPPDRSLRGYRNKILPSLVGFMVGIALATWIEPLTTGGSWLLVIVSTCIVVVVVELIRWSPGAPRVAGPSR